MRDLPRCVDRKLGRTCFGWCFFRIRWAGNGWGYGLVAHIRDVILCSDNRPEVDAADFARAICMGIGSAHWSHVFYFASDRLSGDGVDVWFWSFGFWSFGLGFADQ